VIVCQYIVHRMYGYHSNSGVYCSFFIWDEVHKSFFSRRFCFSAGDLQLPKDPVNLFLSGFIEKSSDSKVDIRAENSTKTLKYICQFSGNYFAYGQLKHDEERL